MSLCIYNRHSVLRPCGVLIQRTPRLFHSLTPKVDDSTSTAPYSGKAIFIPHNVILYSVSVALSDFYSIFDDLNQPARRSGKHQWRGRRIACCEQLPCYGSGSGSLFSTLPFPHTRSLQIVLCDRWHHQQIAFDSFDTFIYACILDTCFHHYVRYIL